MDHTRVGACRGFTLCDPAVGCGGTDVCALLDDGGGGTLDFGACVPTCTPFEAGTAAGCEVGEWCMPDLLDTTVGYCAPDGSTAHGDTCTEITECAAGDWCLGGECDEICEVDATTGPGVCGTAGDLCLELSSETGPLPVGVCIEQCDYHGGGGCASSADTCMMGELFLLDVDICQSDVPALAALADCTAAGLVAGDVCGGNSLCVNDGSGVRCYDACATAEGGFDTVGHPDCRIATDSCQNLFGEPEIGLCFPP